MTQELQKAPDEAKERVAVSSTRLLGFGDALRIARGCLDYGGGYRSDEGAKAMTKCKKCNEPLRCAWEPTDAAPEASSREPLPSSTGYATEHGYKVEARVKLANECGLREKGESTDGK